MLTLRGIYAIIICNNQYVSGVKSDNKENDVVDNKVIPVTDEDVEKLKKLVEQQDKQSKVDKK